MSLNVTIGDTEYFPGVKQIQYEGPATDNPLAFRFYNPDQVVAGKPMKEHFRFSMAYWHTLCNTGGDPFGPGTKSFPWDMAKEPMQQAREKMDAAFEFATKCNLPFYCFHDIDIAPEGHSLSDLAKNLRDMTDYAKQKQQASGVKLLWGTANVFSHPRYMNGAATNPDFNVVACAAAQVKGAIDATIALGGDGYVFWGGREGYYSLLNTQMKREQEHLAAFLISARDYARKQGFKGVFFIEPKPMEHTKHQYDFDSSTVICFLKAHGLDKDFKINIEVNHATLANHTFTHELQTAADAGMLGSMDANRGDYQNGWDTDQFPVDIYEATEAMMVVLEAGGLQGGGINFDAKTRRNSTNLDDLFHAHIGSMDVFAKALIVADSILTKSQYKSWRENRYASFDSGIGQKFELGNVSLDELAALGLANGEPQQMSGRQEAYENLINRYALS